MDHGSSLPGARSGDDLKKRIQGFGSGPEPPPLPDTLWGSVFGNDDIFTWYDDAMKGLSEIAEEIMGEPLTPTTTNPPRDSGAHRVETSDSPGQYCITGTERVVLSKTIALGGEILKRLEVGEEVSVEEVVVRRVDQRVRGRVRHPEGWISLYNLETGHRWAKRLGSVNTTQKVHSTSSSSSKCQDVGSQEASAKDACRQSSSKCEYNGSQETPSKEASLLEFDDAPKAMQANSDSLLCIEGEQVREEASSSRASPTAKRCEKEVITTEAVNEESRLDLLDIGHLHQKTEPKECFGTDAPSDLSIPRLPPPGSFSALAPPQSGESPFVASSNDLIGFDPNLPQSGISLESPASTDVGGFATSGLAPILESQEEPFAQSQALPRGISMFDPMPHENRMKNLDGYPRHMDAIETSTPKVADPPKAPGFFMVPRGISIFDPLSEKNIEVGSI